MNVGLARIISGLLATFPTRKVRFARKSLLIGFLIE
jgi:hypothetical protein